MLLPRFEIHEPSDIGEACEILDELGPEAKVLAGGTDLLVNMKKRVLSPPHLVYLGRVDELRSLDSEGAEVSIGACATASEIAEAAQVKKACPALSTGAGSLGSPLVRNLATIGGNLVSARPAADFPPSLLAYDARVVLKSRKGERRIPLDAFLKGPGETMAESGEILTRVVLPKSPEGAGSAYIKLGLRKALEISLVNVAAYLALDEGGAVREARIALGSVAPTPVRAPSGEKVLVGEKPTEALFAEAGKAAVADTSPIDDFRASAAYKRDMVKVLTRRALSQALESIRAK